MAKEKDLAYILVGDHLGQVKRVELPSSKIPLLSDCASPTSSNPVVSIEPLPDDSRSRQLIANKNGELYIYNCMLNTVKPSKLRGNDSLNKAVPIFDKKVLFIYDKQVVLKGDEIVRQKRGEIKTAVVQNSNLAYAGLDTPLRIYDVERRKQIFEAEPPEKDWLGLRPDMYIAGVKFVDAKRVATCSKSDSVIRVYDTHSNKCKPVISIDLNQTAFNEHADSARFISIASTNDPRHTIVVGSNVGQILAIDLRFNVKQLPKKKLQPRNYKILGGFKGSRGASIKDVKIVPASKVISCSLDRYLRVHDLKSRYLDQHVFMTTKPLCCSPVLTDSAPHSVSE